MMKADQPIEMKLALFLLATLIQEVAFGQQDSLLRGDSTWFAGGGGFITVQLMLSKEPATFYYTYRDDLWVRSTTGDYTIKGDSIYLKCTADCEEWKGSVLGPIIVEDCTHQSIGEPKFNFISTAEDTLTNFTATIINDTSITSSPCSKLIEIKLDGNIVSIQQLKQCSTTCFTIYIPVDMLNPEMVAFHYMAGIIQDNNIRFDGVLLKYIPLRQNDDNKKGKKQKKK
jgi:hypothetical protein